MVFTLTTLFYGKMILDDRQLVEYLESEFESSLLSLGFSAWSNCGYSNVYRKEVEPGRVVVLNINVMHRPLRFDLHIGLEFFEIQNVVLNLVFGGRGNSKSIERVRHAYGAAFVLLLYSITGSGRICGPTCTSRDDVKQAVKNHKDDLLNYGFDFLERYSTIESVVDVLTHRERPGNPAMRFPLLSAPITAWCGGRTDFGHILLERNFRNKVCENSIIPNIPGRLKYGEYASRCEQLFLKPYE